MTTLGEVLSSLAYAELSNLSFADKNTGVISEESRSRIVSHVNEALLRIHSRFVLREDQVLVEMVEQLTTYELKAQFAESYDGPIQVYRKYIKDGTGDYKFKDDVIRITAVQDSLGRDLQLNNKLAPFSVFTPKPKVLQVPRPVAGEALGVTYQARHPVLVPDRLDDEVALPDTLEGALRSYVGFLVYNGMGGVENQGRAADLLKMYQGICLEIEEKDGMGTETRTYDHLFEQRGWI